MRQYESYFSTSKYDSHEIWKGKEQKEEITEGSKERSSTP